MRLYAVYHNPHKPLADDGLVLIKEQFNWLAFILPVVWAIIHQQWLALSVYLGLSLVVQTVLSIYPLGPAAPVILELGIALGFALAAMEFRHRTLMVRGYQELDAVRAEGLVNAERRALENLLQADHVENEDILAPDILAQDT